jgi:hypothetical protein
VLPLFELQTITRTWRDIRLFTQTVASFIVSLDLDNPDDKRLNQSISDDRVGF